MGISNLFRRADPTPPTADEKRMELLARRKSALAKISLLNDRKRSYSSKLHIEEETAQALAHADKAFADGRVEIELGKKPSAPIDTLRERRDTAKLKAAAAAETADDCRAIMARLDAEVAALRAILQEVSRDLAALVQPVIDERIAELAQKHERAEAALREILREEAILTQAFDTHSMANAVGDYRGSAQYADIRIPRPQHPAFIKTYPDAMTRGKALEAEHAAHREEQRAIEWEADRLLGELVSGPE